VRPAYVAPTAPSGWSFAVSPSVITKVGTQAIQTTGLAQGVITNSAGTSVFSWTNPGSAAITITYPGSAATKFSASSLALDETRDAVMWCNVNDAGNISSKSVYVSIYRPNYV
jgi:hypothetical protein